jgi:DNA (cytosine-5)-methyltransferase 1
MKYLSVCSGIEAASVAWHPLGWEAVGYSEIEKFPSSVLEHHYPNVPNFGDMTKFKEWNLDTVNLLVGGTPCQSFSVAGLRKGLEDPRGNLALTYCGILDHFRPQWFVWENVPGVLSSGGGRDFGSFLGAVAELGYGFAYRVLDAQYFGVAQRRRRVFVVGYFEDWRPAAEVLFEPESLRRDNPPSRKARENASVFTPSSIGSYREGAGTLRASGGDLGGGSEHLVAQPYEIGNTLTARMHKGMNSDCNEGQTPVLQPVAYSFDSLASNSMKSSNPHSGCREVNLAKTLDTTTPEPSKNQGGIGIIQQRAVLQAFAKGRNNGGENVVFAPSEVGPSMGASGPPYSRTGNERVEADALAIHNMAVRRLTPVECERLQGFPDNYTDIKHNGKETPDGPRYKALGNSMAVPVMAWIGKRIAEYQVCH